MQKLQVVKQLLKAARLLTAGWWKIKDVESGQIDFSHSTGLANAIPGHTDPDTLFNGDGPADAMSEALDKIFAQYNEAWKRNPTREELHAVLNFVANPMIGKSKRK